MGFKVMYYIHKAENWGFWQFSVQIELRNVFFFFFTFCLYFSLYVLKLTGLDLVFNAQGKAIIIMAVNKYHVVL